MSHDIQLKPAIFTPSKINPMTIVTVTFNPAVDKSAEVQAMVPDDKLRCTRLAFHAGGGGINVSRALSLLGLPSTAVYFQGGRTGAALSDLLREDHVTALPLPCSNETRENLVITELSTGRQYRFGFPGPDISQSEIEDLLIKLTKISTLNYLVVSGSLSPGIDTEIFGRLKTIAGLRGAKLIVDTSGAALKAALDCGLFLIKPSLSEFETLTGVTGQSPLHLIDLSRQLIDSGKSELIVISMGAGGALLVSKHEAIRLRAPEVKVVNTVGAGDSMLAGMIYKLAGKSSLRDALAYGIACGAAATLNPGTSLCRKDIADRLLTEIIPDLSSQ